MAQNDYKPTSFNGEPLTTAKLNQVANNIQFVFERTPRIRYAAPGLTRDTSLKVISGKTKFDPTAADCIDVPVYFGSFFSAGCHPIITCTVETTGGWLRKYASIRNLGSGEIDNTGFIGHVVAHESFPDAIEAGGWLHWTATGY